jgi:hypothetical protein
MWTAFLVTTPIAPLFQQTSKLFRLFFANDIKTLSPKLFRLGVPAKMIFRHADVSTSEAYYITLDRTETALALEKLEAAWARNGQGKKVNGLKYFADEEWREDWLKQFPDYSMPDAEDPPYDRDRLLPQPTYGPPPDLPIA